MEAPLIIFAVLAFVAFYIWNRTKDNLERRRMQLDAQARMLERIGPGEALTEFLRTDEGKRFFSQLTGPDDGSSRSPDPRTRVFVLTTLGLIALFGGFLFVNGVMLPNLLADDPEMPTDILFLVAGPAFLLTGAGVGALMAAWLMHRLAKKWGMVEDRGAASNAD